MFYSLTDDEQASPAEGGGSHYPLFRAICCVNLYRVSFSVPAMKEDMHSL